MGFNPTPSSAPKPELRHDLPISRSSALQMVIEHGWEEFLDALNRKAAYLLGWEADLYSVSTEWVRDSTIETIKARGANGDVLVRLV